MELGPVLEPAGAGENPVAGVEPWLLGLWFWRNFGGVPGLEPWGVVELEGEPGLLAELGGAAGVGL